MLVEAYGLSVALQACPHKPCADLFPDVEFLVHSGFITQQQHGQYHCMGKHSRKTESRRTTHMKTLAMLVASAIVIIGAGRAEAATHTKSAPVKSPESIECSKQADAKGLHGAERKKFRAQCKKELKAKATTTPAPAAPTPTPKTGTPPTPKT